MYLPFPYFMDIDDIKGLFPELFQAVLRYMNDDGYAPLAYIEPLFLPSDFKLLQQEGIIDIAEDEEGNLFVEPGGFWPDAMALI